MDWKWFIIRCPEYVFDQWMMREPSEKCLDTNLMEKGNPLSLT